jgi:alkylation response protein AidB-like acyl-CoA dehydrogenase
MEDGAEALIATRIEGLLASTPPTTTAATEFWRAQFDHGLAWVRFPEGLGGLGIDARWQAVVDERLAAGGAPAGNRDLNVVGLAMAAPTLVAHGSAALQERLLRPLFAADEIWCQLFSEPGAGSDLAGLATRAVPDGDSWIVDGQKVWTTLAHRARWGLLLGRTDPDVPKHRGLTAFVVDMHADGVEVRPLYELTGEAEFNEVYLTGVRIPDARRLGDVGGGWAVALTTLMNERAGAGREIGSRGGGIIEPAVRQWRERRLTDPVRHDQLMQHWVRAEVLRLTEIRAAEAAGRGEPGPEGSVAKLRWAELNQAITEFTLDILGSVGMDHPDGYEFRRPESSQVSTGSPSKSYLRARANSIEGGTSQIMRTILGERILRLPGEPRDDRSVPWREVPRG